MTIAAIEIRFEQDVVQARQKARQIAGLLGFDRNDQTRISTAVSEIARNALQFGGGGEVAFSVEATAAPAVFVITIRDQGPGADESPTPDKGRSVDRTGTDKGIVAARQLMDRFQMDALPGGGSTVSLGKILPLSAPPLTDATLAGLRDALGKVLAESPYEEIRRQNQELLHTMDELRRRQDELTTLNQELADTNRGVLALYAELDEKAAQLSGANMLQKTFLSNMSHEFRTPLNSVLALARLLLDRVDGELTPEQEKQVVFIRNSANNLYALVNDLLDLSKIDAGKIVVRPRDCEAEELFSGLRGMLRPLLATPGLELVIEDPTGIPTLFTDDGKVSQILRNFIANALKFTERGEVRVSAHLSEDVREVVFAVADTGIGISPEDQGRIFDEYVQVESAQQGKPKGTGLGLPISRRLAEMLGGRVWVESIPGLGSTFRASIPIRFGGPGPDAEVASLEPDVTRHSVLVVEDDPATQLLYEKFLKDSGFQALPVTSIRAARQALQRFRPAAVLLDILIPGEDGWSLLGEIKGEPTTRDLPVIVATIQEEKDRGMALGADDYCVKPVDRPWLLEKLRTLTQRQPLKSILLIDDEDVARYIVKGCLAGTRYSVLEASDGPQGLQLAESAQPSVIFLDLMMPGMNGFEVLQRLKDNPATREIPVIVCTSQTLDDAQRLTLQRQTFATLPKQARSREVVLQNVREALRHVAKFAPRKENPENDH